MNVVEKYAACLGKVNMNFDLFAPEAIEMCPGEGLMNLEGYKKSLKHWFPFLERIAIKKVIQKSLKVNNTQESWGCILFDVYYKVNQGEAKVELIHIIKAANEKILSINSFWEFSQFEALIPKHPELKQVFNKEDHKRC